MPRNKKPKEVFNVSVECPYCGKRIVVKKTKTLLESAKPATYSEKTSVEKDSQTKLIQDTKKQKLPKIKGAVEE